MPLPNEPKSVKTRLEDEEDAWLTGETKRRAMSKQQFITRLLRSYKKLPNLGQLWHLEQLDPGDNKEAARQVAARIARGK